MSHPVLVEQLKVERFTPTAGARIVNAMWFVSLTLAITVSMLAILAKQWIVGFSTRMKSPAAHARRWAQRHRTFRDGLDRWHLNAFISGLSITLHTAVALFLAGLNVHLYTLSPTVFFPVVAVSFAVLVFYTSATLAPLWFGTCPTLTPQLILARKTFYVCCEALGLSRRETKPQFDEEVVLDGDDASRDLSILNWMVRSLPAGHDVDVALDVVAGLEKERHLPLIVHSPSHLDLCAAARARLVRLVEDHKTGIVDSAAVARALRCSLFLEDDRLSPIDVEPFLSIRTNDVFVLAAALQLQMDAADMRLDDWVRGRLRFLVEPLADWALSRRSTDHGAAVLDVTRNTVWRLLRRIIAFQVQPEQTNVGTAALLTMAFGSDPATRAECHALVTPALTRIISSAFTDIPLRPLKKQRPHVLVHSLQVWAFLLMRHTMVEGHLWGAVHRSSFDALWMCYSQLLEEIRFPLVEHLTLVEAEKILNPFVTFPPRGLNLSSASLQGAMILLAPSERAVHTRGWSALLGEAAFSIIRVIVELNSNSVDLALDVSSFISQLYGPGAIDPVVVASEDDHETTMDDASRPDNEREKAISEKLRKTPLNLLVTRVISDGSSVSCWSMCCDIPSIDYGALAPVAASFVSSLLMLKRKGMEVGPLVEQLLCEGRGLRLILARCRHETKAVDIAVTGALLDALWWEKTRSELHGVHVTDWLAADTGFDTPQLYIDAVEQQLKAG